jgi:exodeoxyribonuclease V alpha subunit
LAKGGWRDDRTHGRQFVAETIAPQRARGRVQIETFLGSGAIRGVGPSTAKLMYVHFGEKVFDILDQSPERLRELPGIGPLRAKMIGESWREQSGLRELMLFLTDSGIGATRAARIQKQFGPDAIGVIKENPYRLAREIRGIGFTTADQLALQLGIERNSIERIRAGAVHALTEASAQGHCGLPADELITMCAELLAIGRDRIGEAIALEVEARRLVRDRIDDREALFLPWLFLAEKTIASELRRLARGDLPWPDIDVGKALQWVETRTGTRLSPSQREAIALVLRSKVAVITGGPGVGKTTLVNSILRIVTAKKSRVLLAAPTGRAAKRLAESTGRPAKTIHRLLEINPETGDFARDEGNQLECDLLVVDEASMIDVVLMQALVRALRRSAALLLVGDVDQLPAVGPGQVLSDIIRSEAVPVIRLTELFRQAAQSRINTTAHAINEGRPPDLKPRAGEESDFFFVRVRENAGITGRIVELVAERIPKKFGFDPVREIQVLTPMRRSAAGVETLNAALQAALNPNARDADSPRLESLGMTYFIGDKVMQIVNDYEKDVFNGDIGVIRAVDPEQQTAVVEFDGREIEYLEDEIEDLVLSYATTIHKSQGSEYPAVVIALTMQHAIMLQRNLLYTAVTRAKKLVVIAGEERAVRQAVEGSRVRRRWTKLREWLAPER